MEHPRTLLDLFRAGELTPLDTVSSRVLNDGMTHTDTPTSAYGFDRQVTSLHHGNPGYTTGATSRPAGKTHLADSATRRTACGRHIDSSYALIVTHHGMTGDEWADRFITCQQCRRHMTRPERDHPSN